MGLTNSKLWQEVREVYFPTPKSKSNLKSKSIYNAPDPRSPLLCGDNFERTPLQLETTNYDYKNDAFQCSNISPIKCEKTSDDRNLGEIISCITQSVSDPRSPTIGIERTPFDFGSTMPSAELATRFEGMKLNFSLSSSEKDSSGFVTAESEKESALIPVTPAIEDFAPKLLQVLSSTPNTTRKQNDQFNRLTSKGVRTPLGSIQTVSNATPVPVPVQSSEPRKRKFSVNPHRKSTSKSRNATPKKWLNKEN